jgi:hypothetical protein
MKSVGEINQEHGRNATEILLGYKDAVREIAEDMHLPGGAYLDQLTPDQRMRVLHERKAERADGAYRQTLEAYTAEVARYHGELAQRRTHLKERLFKVEGPEGAADLSRAVLASEDELKDMFDIAALAGNEDLARAAFVAAERKGFGNIVHRYFDEVDGEVRSVYAEWTELPPEETLERQVENITRVVQPPDYDRLMPYANATT